MRRVKKKSRKDPFLYLLIANPYSPYGKVTMEKTKIVLDGSSLIFAQ